MYDYKKTKTSFSVPTYCIVCGYTRMENSYDAGYTFCARRAYQVEIYTPKTSTYLEKSFFFATKMMDPRN
jgi:hypothetical protein